MDVVERVREGDAAAFRELTEPYRRELLVHCYRLLGSFQDAEDALQDTLLAAWQGFAGFEGRASVRTWLYRIATHRCLNARRAASRRPALPPAGLPAPSRLGEVVWLEPYPDALLADVEPGPEARYEQAEAVSLAFVTALQVLPPRQLAVLVLRDVLGYRAAEVAVLLDTTVDAVASALKRARAALAALPAGAPPPVGSAVERDVVARFVRAYADGDVDALLALLTDDVRVSMPPVPLEYVGLPAVAEFYGQVVRPDRTYDLVPTRANGQPAFGTYLRAADGTRRGTGLLALTLRGDRVCAVTRFDTVVLASFGLPRALP